MILQNRLDCGRPPQANRSSWGELADGFDSWPVCRYCRPPDRNRIRSGGADRAMSYSPPVIRYCKFLWADPSSFGSCRWLLVSSMLSHNPFSTCVHFPSGFIRFSLISCARSVDSAGRHLVPGVSASRANLRAMTWLGCWVVLCELIVSNSATRRKTADLKRRIE
jgi:hypothetical protein